MPRIFRHMVQSILLLFVLLLGCAGMNYVEAANAQILVKTTPSGYGTVKAGNSSYQATVTVSAVVGGKLTLYAKPNTGYKFVKWEDNSTAATRTVTVPNAKTTTYTATFAVATYTLTVTSNNTNYGTVTGGGTYNHGASATLTATPKTGYHFVQWSDGNTNATRTISNITANATYTATFAINTYTLTVSSNNTNYGTVTGGGTYNHGATANLKATPKTGYHFVQWNDGNTNASRSVTVTAAKTYTATFAINQYTLTVKTATNNTTQGTVRINSGTAGASASATINHGVAATITATPATGYHFVKWNDNNTTASRSVTVTAAATYTATFAINTYTIKFVNGSTTLQTSTVNHGVTPTYSGSTPTKSATVQYTYAFSGWSPTIAAATKDQTYTAQFSSTTRSYKITGASANTNMGTVSGTATKQYGQTVTLTATPKDCFKFVQWNDGNTTNPRTVTVQGTATYTATFEEALSGTCGTDVRWYLNECTGVLRIEGTGAMTNYSSYSAVPWYNNRTSISSVTIASGVTSIGNYSFYGCSNLSSVTIPASVTAIGNYAFYNCWAMESLYITDLAAWCSISRIDQSCSPFYRNVNSSYLGGGNLYVNNTKVTTLTIPNGVTAISNYAFVGFAGITSIQFNKATSIGNFAFAGCHGLTNVTIPNGVTTAGNNSFAYCTHLQSMTIPASVTSLGTYMLYNCGSLTDIYVSWTSSIPKWPTNFTNKSPQSSITLHVPCGSGDLYRAANGWKDYTMQGSGTSNYTLTVKTNNSSFGTVQIDGETAGTNVSKSVHCEDNHTIRATHDPSAGCYHFKQWSDGNTDNPRTVGISANTTFTAEFVEGLTSGMCGPDASYVLSCDSVMTISGSGAIRSMAFDGNTRIKSVVIEEGITAIEGRAFSYCSNMEHITFPNTMTDIGGSSGHVFYCCYKLKSIYIPASVTNIGHFPLLRCNDLEIIQVDPANTVYDSRNNCNAIIETSTNKMIAGCMHTVMPHTTEIIDQFCFEYLHKLKSMLIASSVHTFNGQTFKECENLKDIYVEWTENIPAWSSLTSWSEHYSDNLDPGITLHVPCGKKAMYEAATGWNKYNIVDDHLKGGMCGMYGSNQTWMLSCDSILTIRGNGKMEDFVLIAEGTNAEWSDHREAVKTIVITDGIASIGENAFRGFINLKDIYVYAAENIPDMPASNNPQASVTLHVPCTAIKDYQEADGWKDYTIVTEYTGSGACGINGDNLTWTLCDGELTISGTGAMKNWNSADELPWAAYTDAIQTITIADDVTTIGSNAFRNCTAVTTIELPDHITAIGDDAFAGCGGLKTVTIPVGVTTIGESAFASCNTLTDIYVMWQENIPAWQNMTTNSGITLHIPCGTEALYNAANGWKDYTIVNEMLASGTCGADGDNLTWTLCDSTLTISGTGAMKEWLNTNYAPWYSYQKTITSVIIEDGVSSIGSKAFLNCSKLTSLTIPPSVTSISNFAFYNCSMLESLYISDLAAWCNINFVGISSSPFYSNGVFGSWEVNLYVNGTQVTALTIPDGVTTISNYAFLGFAGITDIQFNQVTTIGSYAFSLCHGLTHVTIPEGVTTIHNNSFNGCSQLQSMSIPASAVSVENEMMFNCEGLTDIYVHWTENIPTWMGYTNKSPQTDITLHVPCGTEELYNAANGWKDYTIEADIPNVKSGTYGPDNIEWTFDYCDSLLTITGNGELLCDQNTWGPNAGGINPNIVKRVFVGKGVTYLGIYTLSYMPNIEYIEVEDGHPTHRTGCNAIIRIGTEQEGDTLIFGCPHTVIPTTCTTIRGYAFWDDHLVTEMTIPSSVRQIANMQGSLWQGNNGNVFYTSNNTGEGLKDLYVEWTKLADIPEVLNNKLGDMTKVRLHVPCGTTALYKQVTGWKNFKEYIEEATSYTVTVTTDDASMGTVSITEN